MIEAGEKAKLVIWTSGLRTTVGDAVGTPVAVAVAEAVAVAVAVGRPVAVAVGEATGVFDAVAEAVRVGAPVGAAVAVAVAVGSGVTVASRTVIVPVIPAKPSDANGYVPATAKSIAPVPPGAMAPTDHAPFGAPTVWVVTEETFWKRTTSPR